MKQSTFPRSGVLILAPNSITSLLPSTLISQVESLLESHRIDDSVNLADQQRKKLQGKPSVSEDEVSVNFQARQPSYIGSLGGRITLRVPATGFPVLHGDSFRRRR